MKQSNKHYHWSVIGAGPAGIAAVGLLLDSGVKAKDILWLDPTFNVGDFGQAWGEVSSNTIVKLFHEFLAKIKSFDYAKREKKFALDDFELETTCELKNVTEPLQWVTNQLKTKVNACHAFVEELYVENGAWVIDAGNEHYAAEKVILATGAEEKTLHYKAGEEIALTVALSPQKLAKAVSQDDTLAVFGSSHSAMIIIRSLLELGVKKIINFYQSPIRYAIRMDDWILYDNTGLKGETARWAHENVSAYCHERIERYLSNANNIGANLSQCDKIIYAIGFKQRAPVIHNINLAHYDYNHGIIAPGLFGCGIGFPKQVVDKFGHYELNVGLFKFMNDLRAMMPLWFRYGL